MSALVSSAFPAKCQGHSGISLLKIKALYVALYFSQDLPPATLNAPFSWHIRENDLPVRAELLEGHLYFHARTISLLQHIKQCNLLNMLFKLLLLKVQENALFLSFPDSLNRCLFIEVFNMCQTCS